MGALSAIRSEKGGEVCGWFHDHPFDLFVWIDGDTVARLQVCLGDELAQPMVVGATDSSAMILSSQIERCTMDTGTNPSDSAEDAVASHRVQGLLVRSGASRARARAVRTPRKTASVIYLLLAKMDFRRRPSAIHTN